MTRVIKRSRRLVRGAGIVVLLAGANLLATAVSAVAQYPGGTPPPTVGGQKFFPETARTGVDVLWLILAALLVLLLGLALRRVARRTGSSES